MNRTIIELVNIVKNYGNKNILNNLCMKIEDGEFITILGPSGSGKTTILRLIGGFEWPTRGEIKFKKLDVKDLSPHKRFTNTIFQNYALFPHLNVEKNIQYGLKLKRIPLNSINPRKIKKLEQLKKEWINHSKLKMKKLDEDQNLYERIMSENKKNSKKYKKALKWLDDSDFKYSYWENYLNLQSEKYTKKQLSKKISKKELKNESDKIIKRIGLVGYEYASIDELSGGMQQRVALARSIINKPKVLLLDEPFSALDLKVRQEMQVEVKELHHKLGITFILVTHNQEEALMLSDRVAVMRSGIIEQFDTPINIYRNPINSWVAKFIGESNIFKGIVKNNNSIQFTDIKVLYKIQNSYNKNTKIDILIRPENMQFCTKEKAIVEGTLVGSSYYGNLSEKKVELISGKIIKINLNINKKLEKKVYINWRKKDIHIMERQND